MQEKVESQRVILSNVAETLKAGLGIQWALSIILGEVTALKIAAFLITTFLLVSFLHWYGTSRLWLYATMMQFGLFLTVVYTIPI